MIYIDQLVFASHNEGKINEVKRLLAPYDVKVFSANELALPDVEETGTTFEENAILKAETLAEMSKLVCLADDSGLCINALGGRPGVYSARYAPNRDFVKGAEMLLEELKDVKNEDRSAYFSCVLALAIPGEKTMTFEGRVDGEITKKPKGKNGFGFDPIFKPYGFDKTFAEMSLEDKSEISHRGRALKKFVDECFKE